MDTQIARNPETASLSYSIFPSVSQAGYGSNCQEDASIYFAFHRLFLSNFLYLQMSILHASFYSKFYFETGKGIFRQILYELKIHTSLIYR